MANQHFHEIMFSACLYSFTSLLILRFNTCVTDQDELYLSGMLVLQHNFTDGMALGSAFLLHGSIGGWSRTLFLLAHELPQEVRLLSFADINTSFSTFVIWILCSEYIISICRRQRKPFLLYQLQSLHPQYTLCSRESTCFELALSFIFERLEGTPGTVYFWNNALNSHKVLGNRAYLG